MVYVLKLIGCACVQSGSAVMLLGSLNLVCTHFGQRWQPNMNTRRLVRVISSSVFHPLSNGIRIVILELHGNNRLTARFGSLGFWFPPLWRTQNNVWAAAKIQVCFIFYPLSNGICPVIFRFCSPGSSTCKTKHVPDDHPIYLPWFSLVLARI